MHSSSKLINYSPLKVANVQRDNNAGYIFIFTLLCTSAGKFFIFKSKTIILFFLIPLLLQYCSIPEKKVSIPSYMPSSAAPSEETASKETASKQTVIKDNLDDARLSLEMIGIRYTAEELANLKILNLSNTRVSDRDMEKLKGLRNLEILRLKNTEIDGSGLGYLAKNEKLKSIDLEGSKIKDSNLGNLLLLKELTDLNLSGIRISKDSCLHLRAIIKLKNLDLSGTGIDDSCLINIAGSKALEGLILKKTGITDTGLVHLKELNNLNYLDLSHTQVEGSGVVNLAGCVKLKTLLLAYSGISDIHLEQLKQLKEIEYLDLSDTGVTNKGLESLSYMENLKYLNIANTGITGEGFYLFGKFKGLKYLSINGISTTYADFMRLKTALPHVIITAQYMIFPTYSQAEDKKEPEKEIPSTEYIGQVSIRELLVIGLSSPFELAFFDKNKNIDKDYQLKSNLIFKLAGSSFTIASSDHHYKGLGTVEFPYKEADFKQGILRGRISLDRIITGGNLEAYLKKDNDELELIGKTEIRFLVSDIGGILFSGEFPSVKAGHEFELQVYPFDYHGKQMTNISKALIFNITGRSAISLNGTETSGQFKVEPALFVKGIAKISIRACKQGTYGISYMSGKSFYQSRTNNRINGSWNNFSFNIVPAEPVRAEHIMPDKIIAGKAFNITRILYDVYDNVTESGQFDVKIIPFPENFLTLNDNFIKNDVFIVNNRLDKIIIKKTGLYSILLPDIEKIIKKNITVEPDAIECAIDKGNIMKTNEDSRVVIPFQCHDRYGNAPVDNMEFKIKMTYSSRGSAVFNGDGMRAETNIIKTGKYKIADILLNIDKKDASLIVNTRNTDFLKITTPGNDDINLKLALPVRIVMKKHRIEFDYTESNKKFTFTAGNLSVLLKKYTESELFVTWQGKKDNVIIQYEFTYYRELNRLDYQEWDLTNKKRILRILWGDVSENAIHKAALSGLEEIPGNNERFK